MKKTIFTAMLLASLFFGSSGSADAQVFVGDRAAAETRYRANITAPLPLVACRSVTEPVLAFTWRCRLFRPMFQTRCACPQVSERRYESWTIEYEDSTATTDERDEAQEYLPEEPSTVVGELLLQELNATRRRYGLRELILDETLQEGATAHCENEARRGAIFHAQGCGWEITAQNYDAQGIKTALSQWLSSRPHASILLGNFTKCGVASHRSSDGRNYCTVRFR